MLNNNDFISLERRLWREGNPLADELLSTRDTLASLMREAKEVMEKYSPMINKLSEADDLDFYREWDNFGDTLENLAYDLGIVGDTQYKLHEERALGPNPLDKFPSIKGKS
jgi:hypothetical protein